MVRAFYISVMARTIITLLALCVCGSACAQDQARYQALVKEAYALYEKKAYKASAARYSTAFRELGWKGHANDRYNAACSWALAGEADSAFFNLYRLAEKMDYSNLPHITTDSDLKALYSDVRWEPLIALVRANKERLEANLDKPLVALLDSIHAEDQGMRRRIDEVEAKYGRESKEMQAHWQRIHEKDSMNLIVVERILNERGWLGEDVVGRSGNSTLFLVIQHADLSTQEKYLPMMRDAVKKGNARGSDLALLEDRILMRNGKRQLYGSQIGRDPDSGEYYLSPIEDPDNVDRRRAEMGMQPLADYLMNWDMNWDVEAYKKQLPALEERIRARKW
jgi:hypothetical protein